MRKLLLPALLLCSIVVACSDDDSAGPDTGGTAPPSSTTIDDASSTSSTSSTTSTTTEAPSLPGGMIAFSGQGNDLAAYDLDGNRRLVIQNADDDPENGRDINGQICFLDDRTFVAGEDTGQPEQIPGWGIFTLAGDTLDELSATQIGKMIPVYQPADSQPEMFGCGVLPDGRVVTTDVGNQASGPGTGQLMVWFPPIEGVDERVCMVDTAIATAQQIAIDGDDVLVASARPPTLGIHRYTDLPETIDDCDRNDAAGALIDDDVPAPTLFIDPSVAPDGEEPVGIANGIVASGNGTWYVSSVLSGRIAEYDAAGAFIRTILAPPADETLGPEPFSTGTPNGLGVTADGTLWYADLGLVFDGSFGPGRGTGTVRVIRFVDGEPQPPETIDSGLAFPDAIGILPGGTR